MNNNEPYMSSVVLKKSAMAFELKDGTTLLINKEDVSAIANAIVMEMVCHCPERLLMPRDLNEPKVHLLYKVFQEQKNAMPEELQHKYLELILELQKSKEVGVQTLDEVMKENKSAKQ